jgi:hypothetical protein
LKQYWFLSFLFMAFVTFGHPLILKALDVILRIKNRSLILALLFNLICLSAFSQAQQDSVTYSLFLVGDAGEPFVSKSPIGKVLRNMAGQFQKKSTVLYLGDNIYPGGLADLGFATRQQGEEVLQLQVDWIKGLDVNGIFIPGNHDWAHWGQNGLQFIHHQEEFLDSLKDAHFTLLPKEGCPGPVEVKIASNITLVVIDTQWFLHQWDKPGLEGECEGKTLADVLTLLNDILYRNRNKRVIVAGHHPLVTYGNHGGYFTFKNHIFPFLELNPDLYIPMPVLGSFYPFYRKYFGHIQDNTHPLYRELSQGLQTILKQYPNTIYVAGHEHNLQHSIKDNIHHIVSGSASKYSDVRKKGYAQFVDDVTGFGRLDFFKDGSSLLQFYQVDNDFPEGKEIYQTRIPAPPKSPDPSTISLPDFSKVVVNVNASNQYRASRFKKFMLGENYRKEWETKVKVPLFDIKETYGPLKILQKGGGQQTMSLRLEDSTGHEYVIRTVEKFPEMAVPEMLRKTFAQDLVQDQISASHPYAAIVIPDMAEAAGIYHTNPKVYFVPDDPRLGEYQKDFANTLVLFEERPAGDWSEASNFGNSKKIINTSKVLEKLYDDNDNFVDQEFVVKARLFDLIIGDWDRHDDQWRWATFKEKKGDSYRPIPRDRDQAFFVNEGKLSSIWSRKWALPKFEGFDYDIRWPSGFSFNARYFDRTFLNGLSKDQWIKAARELKKDLTDEAIEKAIRQWPESIFKLHGQEIIAKIKSRRDDIEKYAVSHYEFLAKETEIVGSNKRELVVVERQPDGNSRVKMFKITKEGEVGKLLYDRLFLAKETKEIRIFGLGGDDRFEFKGESKNAIDVRVIGGKGGDLLEDGSKVLRGGKNIFYYDSGNSHLMYRKGNIKATFSDNPLVNSYDRKAFQFNRFAPLIFGNFNPDDGLFVGGGFVNINHGFRKTPFKSRHVFLASVAPLTSSYNFKYQGKFTEAIGVWDVNIQADLKSPNYVNNFFGMGNESVFDRDIEDKPDINVDESIHYYRYRFEEIKLEPSVSRKIGNFSTIQVGPSFQRIEMEDPESGEDRFIYQYAQTLTNNLFDEYRSFAGINYQLQMDHRDDPKFTRRGIDFQFSGRNMAGLNKEARNFSFYETSLSVIHSFRSNARLVFAVRSGAGWNTGNYAFYQSQILDGRTELRGYRKTRFYGDRKFYSNFEVRLRLLSFRSYLFPANLGILGFHDLGRVWYKDSNGVDPSTTTGKSNLWHKGYGGGIWFTPFNFTVLSTEFGHSGDGNMVYVRLGFLF